MFSCVWLHFKKCFEKYFLMFGCVLENTIENTFSWKYHRKHIFYLLLTFSHIFLVAKRIYNIVYSSKHKQNPEKNHQIRTLRAIAISAKARSRSAWSALRMIMIDASHDHDRSFARSRLKLREITINAVSVMSADDIGKLGFGRSLLSLFSFSLSLSFTCDLKMVWR